MTVAALVPVYSVTVRAAVVDIVESIDVDSSLVNADMMFVGEVYVSAPVKGAPVSETSKTLVINA